MSAFNVYEDPRRAEAYATLGFPGTYYLAYRDLPTLIAQHVEGRSALDFGCGAGRSTRFLEELGFQVTGIDISPSMIELARKADPAGSYRLVDEGEFAGFEPGSFDVILSAFAFDNMPDADRRARQLRSLRDLLKPNGRVVLLSSAPEIYTHEWASFTTRDFPENRTARSGDVVRIVMKDVTDRRPVVDHIWFHEDYLRLFASGGLDLLACHRPLGRRDEPYDWHTELSISPWVIYVLGRTRA